MLCSVIKAEFFFKLRMKNEELRMKNEGLKMKNYLDEREEIFIELKIFKIS